MLRYLAGRLGQAVFVAWAAFTVTFVILYVMPEDPIAIMLDMRGDGLLANPAQVALLRAEHGFDQPVPLQYLHSLWRALHGEFGTSIQLGQPVTTAIAAALPHTLALAGLALGLALTGGIGLALLATWTRQRWLRELLLALPGLGVSVPAFWVGLVLLQLLSFRWHLFPAMGNAGAASLVLPAVTLAIPTAAGVAQVLAKSLQATWAQAYIATALAKGASRPRVHLRHAFRNALIPALTLFGLSVGHLLGGSVVTETVFSRTGIGRLTEFAVKTRDIPLVQGLVVLSTVVFVAANLVVDLLCPLIDPRLLRGGRQPG
ncbi:ABC transporter permease [Rhodovastum atsumiense]|uniref:ABC transporter permease n=1 Tax=Rhodovastum atsumiense TaxID=504468 RepID=A0A5M6IVM7_9PROT|nr:ABC transporter permease [Rhodovastum atsumiense]KAA5611979.1 ABC transporter permease [Rhodovastum atsumiense]CAH2598758.1 ABC transporter permease [Rhodovastum atsumiense]